MDRAFDFGPLRIEAALQGEQEGQPVFKITASAPGASVDFDVGTKVPLPSEAVLHIVEDMRKVLKMGAARHAQLKAMRERRLPAEAAEVRAASERLFAVARAVPGGDAALAAAEEAVRRALDEERERFERDAEEVEDAVERSRAVGFDLGPLRVAVEWVSGAVVEETPLALFSVTAAAPGVADYRTHIMTNAPLFSMAVEWLLGEMRSVLSLGPERYAAQAGRPEEERSPEEKARDAAALYDLARAVGLAGLDHAAAELARASAQERADAEELELKRLEEERAEIEAELARLRSPRRRPRGR